MDSLLDLDLVWLDLDLSLASLLPRSLWIRDNYMDLGAIGPDWAGSRLGMG